MFSKLLVVTALAVNALGLNIMLTNDDSWASANIRQVTSPGGVYLTLIGVHCSATYSALKSDGHNVMLIGAAVQQSGKGGSFVTPNVNITAPGGEFGTIPVGARYFGQDTTNKDFWYFNGTPAAVAAWGLDVIAPIHFGKPGNESIDLVVSGPNEGFNQGPFLYTLSGTVGAAYFSIERGVPAVAFSAGNGTHRSFTTNTGAQNDPANLAANVVRNLVRGLERGINTNRGQRILPLGVGVSVNIPLFGPSADCTDPPFVLTRMTKGAEADILSINSKTGFPSDDEDAIAPGAGICFNGLCGLPGETAVSETCHSSVSVFTVDYDAPTIVAAPIQARLGPISRSFFP